MAYCGTDNLRCYVREAVLPAMVNGTSTPAMPLEGHKSHLNTLAIRPELYRKLESIYRFKVEAIDEMITSWVDTCIPENSLDHDDEDEVTGERLSIPCPPLFNIPPQRLTRPSDVNRLAPWLDNLPLQTVQRVLHLVFPQTIKWGFLLDNEKDTDDSIFRHFFWTLPSLATHQNPQISQHSVVVAFQPPWILAPHDFQRFVDCRSFPPFHSHGHTPAPLTSKERLWGKLWDLCVRKKCPWFVVSTYTGWCFGAFSRGWTIAFVSSIYDFDSCSPTIVECLLFWLASAMALPGGWKIPEVAEPLDNLALGFSIPQPHDARFISTPSESSWEGKSDETGSSAGLERPLSPVVSECGLPNRRTVTTHYKPGRRPELYRKVSAWMRAVTPSNALPPDERTPSPVMSEAASDCSWSSSSGSTVVDHTLNGGYCGDWLVLPTAES